MGTLVAVFSPQGGAGCTTIAINLAVALHRSTGLPTALVDGNLTRADIAIHLNLDPQTDTVVELTSGSRLVNANVEQGLVRHVLGINVLLGPATPERAEGVRAEDWVRVLRLLTEDHAYVVVDTASAYSEVTLKTLDAADLILVPTLMELTSMKNTRVFLEIAERLGYPADKVQLVVNKFDPDDGIDLTDAETSLGRRFLEVLPSERTPLVSAVNRGFPVVASAETSNIAQGIFRLADRVSSLTGRLPANPDGAAASLVARAPDPGVEVAAQPSQEAQMLRSTELTPESRATEVHTPFPSPESPNSRSARAQFLRSQRRASPPTGAEGGSGAPSVQTVGGPGPQPPQESPSAVPTTGSVDAASGESHPVANRLSPAMNLSWLVGLGTFVLVLTGVIQAYGSGPGVLRGFAGGVISFFAELTGSALIMWLNFVGWGALLGFVFSLLGAARGRRQWFVPLLFGAGALASTPAQWLIQGLLDWLGGVSRWNDAAYWGAAVGVLLLMAITAPAFVRDLWRWCNGATFTELTAGGLPLSSAWVMVPFQALGHGSELLSLIPVLAIVAVVAALCGRG